MLTSASTYKHVHVYRRLLRATGGGNPWPLVLLVFCGALSWSAPPVHGQVIIHPAVVRPPVNIVEQMIFAHVPSSETARQRFHRQLSSAIDALDRDCQLAEVQREKLNLAGRGDIVRLFNQVNAVKDRYRNAQLDQATFRRMMVDVEPLKKTMESDLFQEGSLFQKVWRNVATAEQLVRIRESKQRAEESRRQMLVQSAVATVAREIPLTETQRETLLKLLAVASQDTALTGAEDFVTFRLKLYNLPDEQLSEVFNEQQMKTLADLRAKAGPLLDFLKQRGVRPNQPPVPNPLPPEIR